MAGDGAAAAAEEGIDVVDDGGDFNAAVAFEGGCVVEEEVELLAQRGVPQEGERGRVAGRDEVDVRGGGEVSEDGGARGALEGVGVEGVYEEVYGERGGVGGEVGQEGGG